MPRNGHAGKVGTISRRLTRNLDGVARDLGALLGALRSAAAEAARAAASGRGAPRVARRRALTPKDRARLKLQGEYLGLVRHLSKRHRPRVMALRARSGYPPAIRLARSLMKKD